MKSIVKFFAAILLLTGCSHHEEGLNQQIVGTWTNGNVSITYASDGTFSAMQKFGTNGYGGNWTLKKNFLTLTITRSDFSDTLPAGSTQTVRIVNVTSSYIDADEGGRTNRMGLRKR
jgi:hypothetical protein